MDKHKSGPQSSCPAPACRKETAEKVRWTVHSDGCGQVWSPFGLVAEVHTGDDTDPRVNGGYPPTERNPNTKDAWEKVQANAALIASAPDLKARNEALSAALATAKDALRTVLDIYDSVPGEADFGHHWTRVRDVSRNAIASLDAVKGGTQ